MYENELDVHDNEHAGETDFYTNGFAQTRFHTEVRGKLGDSLLCFKSQEILNSS